MNPYTRLLCALGGVTLDPREDIMGDDLPSEGDTMSNKNNGTTITADNTNTVVDQELTNPTSTPISDGIMAQLAARRKKLMSARVSGAKGVYTGVMKSAFEATGKGFARQTLNALLAAGKAGITASLEHDEDFEVFAGEVWTTGENFAKRHLAANEELSGAIQAGLEETGDELPA